MAREADPYYTPAQRIGRYQDIFDQMQNLPSGTQMRMLPPPQPGVHGISNHTASSALQGPQDPSMQALFSQPAPHLQQMAGEVVHPNPHSFGPNVYTDDYWKRVSQPAGYATPAAINAVGQGVMGGNVRILSPQAK